MKKYIRLAAVTLGLCALLCSLPLFLRRAATPVTLIVPQVRSLSQNIPVSGEVEAVEKRELYTDLPLVLSKLAVSIGDAVETGDVIAEVNMDATKNALASLLEQLDLLPEEYIAFAKGLRLSGELLGQVIPSVITATSSGIVTGLGCSAGELLLPNVPLCTISDLSRLRIRIRVPESDVGKVEIGDQLVFRVPAVPNKEYVGRITMDFPEANTVVSGITAQTVLCYYAAIESTADKLKPGYSVEGNILKKETEEALLLPYGAVGQDEKNREYVYLCENGRAVRREIVTGAEFADGVVVLSGIEADSVLVEECAAVRHDGDRLCGKEE